MKRIFKYAFAVLAVVLAASCTNDKELFDFTENPGPGATFVSSKLSLPGLKAEDGGKVLVPLYRSNTKGTASVAVAVEGGEGVFTPTKAAVEFADGESLGYLQFTYDFEALSAKPTNITVAIANEEDAAIDAVTATTFTLVKQLTYEPAGEGVYYSDWYGEEWAQEVYKAKEGNYFILPSCWVSGVDFSFFCDGTTVDWYTTSTGYNYGSYGPLALNIVDAAMYGLELVVSVEYYLPEYYNYNFGGGVEVFVFPEGFTF